MHHDGESLSEVAIRPALRSWFDALNGDTPGTGWIEELGICRGQVRIDLALIGGDFHGFEIKSDRDSLRRLDGQVAMYSKVLDHATLVVGNRYLSAALAVLPDWWGVILVRSSLNGPQFTEIRQCRANPDRDPRAIVELLWLDDAVDLLDQRNAARGVRGKHRGLVWDRVCEHFELDEIADVVRKHLKARIARQAPGPPG